MPRNLESEFLYDSSISFAFFGKTAFIVLVNRNLWALLLFLAAISQLYKPGFLPAFSFFHILYSYIASVLLAAM